MAVRPFQFTGLPRYSKEEVALQQSMAAYLSYRPLRASFRHTLADALGQHLKTPLEISEVEFRAVDRYELGRMLPSVACLAQISVGPNGHTLLADIDTSLAMFAIERLLGGNGRSTRMRRPLTDIEEGVLSFLLLRALSHFQEGWETGRELPLVLDRFGSSLQDFQDLLDAEPLYQMLAYRLAAGRRTGYVRILIPQGLISSQFGAPPAQGSRGRTTERELGYMRRVLGALPPRQVGVRLEVAHIDLHASQREHLEPGDIIVLENHQLSLSAAGIAGQVFATVGSGNNGGFRAQVIPHADHMRLQVVEIVQQEEPPEEPMPEVEGNDAPAGSVDELEEVSAVESVSEEPSQQDAWPEGEQDNLQETEGLLRDIPAPIVVELGRVRMSTAQVVRLRAGEVLRLQRGPNDPVALVVNGKMFARGELVEVDGELGVRLLQVVGAG